MRAVFPMLLLILSTICVSGQPVANTFNASSLEVIQQKWRVDVRDPLLEEDPFKAINETQQAIRERKEILRQEELRRKQGLPPEPRNTRTVVQQPPPDPPPTAVYSYEIKVKNTGEKAIQTFIWDYVFLDPGTDQEVGRLRFESKVGLGPGKTKSLVMRTISPPTGTVDARKVGKKSHQQYAERIVIQGVEYADGTVWLFAKASAN